MDGTALNNILYCFIHQVGDMKKRLDDEGASLEQSEESKKKVQREMEALQGQLEEALSAMEKLDKTKLRLQREVGLLFSQYQNLSIRHSAFIIEQVTFYKFEPFDLSR